MSGSTPVRLHFEHHADKLIELMDSEFGLLNKLLEDRVLSYSEIGRIKAEPTRYRKNEKLLDYIFKKDKHDDLMAALSQSSQTHVVNWIVSDGNYRKEFGLDWPLTDKENGILDDNQSALVDTLDTGDLLNMMFSREIINMWQKTFIESKPTDCDRNEAVLDIARRLSRKDYYKMVQCLRESNQMHIADTLEFGGAIVPVHAKLESDNLDAVETQIVSELADLFCQRTVSVEQASRMLAALQLKVIAAKRGQSIVLYTSCCKDEELDHLRKIVDNLEMKDVLERLFNLFFNKVTIKVLSVKIHERDITKAMKAFERNSKNETIRNRIMNMYEDFISEVNPKDIFGLLIQKGVMSAKDKQKVMNKATTMDRCRALLDHLGSCSEEDAFVVLREALQVDYPWVIKRLDHGCYEEDRKTVSISKSKSCQSLITDSKQEDYEDKLAFNRADDKLTPKSTSMDDYHKKDLKFTKISETFGRDVATLKVQLAEANMKPETSKHLRQSQFRIKQDLCDQAVKRNKSFNLKGRTSKSSFAYIGLGGHLEIRKRKLKTANSKKFKLARLQSSKLQFGSFAIIIGGVYDDFSISEDVIRINLNKEESVSYLQQSPTQMTRESAAAVHDNTVFVTGIGKNCDEVWRFNAKSSKWKECASLIQGRRRHSVAFVDHVLYICGGYEDLDETLLDGVEAYDTLKDECFNVGKLVFPVCSSGNCVPFKSSVYIFGGYDANSEAVNSVQVFNTESNACTLLLKPMPVTVGFLRAVLWENTVILLGRDDCLIYNFETEAWKIRDEFKTGVNHFGMIAEDSKVFIIGGRYTAIDADDKCKWICRDDVRCVPIMNILNNEPIEWRHHARLSKPSVVHAYGKIDF